jgi:hypothetical protein
MDLLVRKCWPKRFFKVPTVGAVYDRALFLGSTKYARS